MLDSIVDIFFEKKNKYTFDEKAHALLGLPPDISSADEVENIHKAFIELRTKLVFEYGLDTMPHYRGEQNYGWQLRPGIFRDIPGLDMMQAKALEKLAVSEFERVVAEKIGKDALRSIFNSRSHGKDWDLLFQTQHAGVKTTLMDWTARWERALFFAVEESKNEAIENASGQFWCIVLPTEYLLGQGSFLTKEGFYDIDPWAVDTPFMINASFYMDNIDSRLFEYRMFRQLGRFFCPAQKDEATALDESPHFAPYLFRFKISPHAKKEIREVLAKWDLTRAAMYIEEKPEHQRLIEDINKKIYGK